DAGRLALGSEDGSVAIFTTDGKKLHSSSAARTRVQALAWSPDARLLAVGAKDGKVILEEPEAHAQARLIFSSGSPVTTLVYHSDGRYLLAAGGSTKMWDVTTGERVLTGSKVAWGFSKDGRTLATSAYDGAAFCDLILPRTMQTLGGQQGV